MLPDRLSPLDASFLAVESPAAHMHVGWATVFEPPMDRPRPSFDALRAHVARRLSRAPRYRQVLRALPLGIGTPAWVDDESFEIDRHVVPAQSDDLSEIVDESMSRQLERDRPLWELTIAERLHDGRAAVVGKAHHCMVDGLAAVELSSLLLDDTPDAPDPEPDGWEPEPAPGDRDLVAGALRDLARGQLGLAKIPAQVAASPRLALSLAGRVRRAGAAVVDAARLATPHTRLNQPISPMRHLGRLLRPTADLVRIKEVFGVTLNDVVLAVGAGGVRRFLHERGDQPVRLKTMVPVSVRGDKSDELGNAISFMFIPLPCDEPDPVHRLRKVNAATAARKRGGNAAGGSDVIRSIGMVPGPVRGIVSRLMASPEAFNLVISNIPGPREPLYMRGSRLVEAYPVVPIADRHALSIGISTLGEDACFGLYADRESLPEIDSLATYIDSSIDELLRLAAEPTPAAERLAVPPG
jgi:WS/DGAT/MGAT family acyltransferase